MENDHLIYIVSDSVGETAESVVWAAVSQFTPIDTRVEQFSFVRERDKVDQIIHLAEENKALVVFTLVLPELSLYLKKKATEAGIGHIDLMSPMLDHLSHFFKKQPLEKPGLSHLLNKDYFRKIEAVEFAVKYDDCKDPRGILWADIVLLGVSRTSKTPLSQFLAFKKYKVANVPVIPEIKPPEELFQIDSKKIIGLKINPERLVAIRAERLAQLGLCQGAGYADRKRIDRELDYFHKLVKRVGCQVIDVSHRAVEETASDIINHYLTTR